MQYSEKKLKKIESNIYKYTIHLITNKRVFAAILSLYYLTIPNVGAQEIGLIMFIGSIASFLFEVPSGYISDKFGHKNALIASHVLLILSSLAYLIADNLYMLILGSTFLSLSFACASGSGTAFMHDTLKALGKDDKYSEIMGKAYSLGYAVPIVFMVLSPFLIEISYKAPFVLSLITDMIGLIAVISLTRVKQSEEDKKIIKETKFKEVFKQMIDLGYMPFAVLSAIIVALIFNVQIYRAPYQEFVGADVIWFGVYFGLGRALVSAISAYAGKLKNYFNIFSYYKFQIFINTLFLISIAFINNVWFVIAAFIVSNGIQWGFSQVGSHFTLEIIGDSKFKATLISIKGQIVETIKAISALAIGFMIGAYSYQTAFLILGIFMITSTLIFYVWAKIDYNNRIKVKEV